MVVGSPELVVARCQDLSQELINRDLHLVVGDVVLSYHQVILCCMLLETRLEISPKMHKIKLKRAKLCKLANNAKVQTMQKCRTI